MLSFGDISHVVLKTLSDIIKLNAAITELNAAIPELNAAIPELNAIHYPSQCDLLRAPAARLSGRSPHLEVHMANCLTHCVMPRVV